MPDPSGLVVKKGTKMRSCTSAGMPVPWSFVGVHVASQAYFYPAFGGGCLAGVLHQVDEQLLHLPAVGPEGEAGIGLVEGDVWVVEQLSQVAEKLVCRNRGVGRGGQARQFPVVFHKVQQALAPVVDGL